MPRIAWICSAISVPRPSLGRRHLPGGVHQQVGVAATAYQAGKRHRPAVDLEGHGRGIAEHHAQRRGSRDRARTAARQQAIEQHAAPRRVCHLHPAVGRELQADGLPGAGRAAARAGAPARRCARPPVPVSPRARGARGRRLRRRRWRESPAPAGLAPGSVNTHHSSAGQCQSHDRQQRRQHEVRGLRRGRSTRGMLGEVRMHRAGRRCAYRSCSSPEDSPTSSA